MNKKFIMLTKMDRNPEALIKEPIIINTNEIVLIKVADRIYTTPNNSRVWFKSGGDVVVEEDIHTIYKMLECDK